MIDVSNNIISLNYAKPYYITMSDGMLKITNSENSNTLIEDMKLSSNLTYLFNNSKFEGIRVSNEIGYDIISFNYTFQLSKKDYFSSSLIYIDDAYFASDNQEKRYDINSCKKIDKNFYFESKGYV